MKNTRLIKLLETFSKADMREFSDYVESPFYNKNKNVVNLFKVIGSYYPGFESKQFTEEKLYKKLFKGEKYDYYKLKNIISDLYRLGMGYLREKYRGNTFENDLTFIMELRQRKLMSHYESEYKKIEKKHLETAIREEEFFLNDLRMSAEKSYYNFLLKPNTGFNLAQDQLNSLLTFALIRFLKLYTLMVYETKQNNVVYDLKFIEEIKQYITAHDDETNPTFLLYKHILLLELYRKEEDYFRIKEIHSNHLEELTEKDRYMSYIHRGGYCAFVFNIKGEKSFLNEMLQVHKGMLGEEFFNSYGMVYPDFVNFVKIGVLNGEFEYVNDFIEQYKSKLSESEYTNCLNYSEAYISFHKGDKLSALELLSRTNFNNFILKIQVKILQIQIYSELEMYDQLLSAIDTCRHYLRSEGYITELYKTTISDFLTLANDITLMTVDPIRGKDDLKKRELAKKVTNLPSNVFGVKMWLQDRAAKVLY
jgi:hypothetical protein